jgi:ABC-type multidrug transport system ATPase subunit/ABC-type multidrug transport system permease subunit
LIKRQFLLLSRNKVFLTFRTMSSCVISVIFGGMYYQKSTTIQADVLARYGLFLNTLLQLSFTNMSEMATNVEFKFCAYKHVASNTFPRFAYVLAAQLAHIPIAIVETLIAGSILYWMAGLAPYASNWIFFVLCGFLANVFMGAMFRTFAYAMPTLQAAQSAPMPLISILILFAGFMISQSHMGWTLIFFYIDIYGWLYRAMAQNEFLSPAFEFTAPRFGNSTAAPVPMGSIYLQMFDIQTDPVWMGYGVLHAFVSIVIVVVCSFLAFSYIQYDRNIGSARRLAEPDDQLLARLGSKGGPKTGQEIALQIKGAIGTQKSSSAHSHLADHVSKKVDTRSSLPFTPISVSFSDLKYTVILPDGKEKCILQGISGFAAPGRLCSLMGASGSGKTTLLDVLASRKNNGKIEGKMLLNGFPKDEGVFSRLAAYVEQQDIHMPLTTVREALQFSAAMRLPSEVTEEQREAFIDEVLMILELSDIQDRKVGEIGAADALAPGERKRLTIAVELVSNSPVIFLDEPTSGLDARAAAVVMRVIKNVADTGRTVICTIHQPSSDLFFMFDDLLLLQKGGYMVYFGPLGEGASAFVEYMEGMDGVKPCPPNFNPASWMLDVMANTDSSIAADDSAVEPEHRVVHTAIPGPVLASRFVESPQWKSTSAVMARLAVPVDGSKPVSFDVQQVRTWFEQFVMLVQRTQRSYSRNIGFNGARVNSAIVLMLLYGIVYFDKASEAVNVSGVSSLVACIFMTATFFGMLNMQASIPDLVKNRATFYREQAAHMYDPFAYSLANITVEVPWTACIMLAVLPIVYFMLGLSSDASTFFSHYIISFALALVFISIGHLMAAAMPSYEVAMSAAGAIAPLTFLFGGMFAPVPSMPAGARWVASIDPVYYTFQALIPIHFWCDASVPGVHCPTIPVPSVTSAGGVASMDRYKYVTKTYDMTYDAHWTNFGYIWIFFVVLQVGTMLNIKYRRYIVR